MKVKRIFKFVLPICFLMVLGITTVNANTSTESWAKKIPNSYIGLDWQTKSSSSSKSMTINWKEAEGSSKFDLYFRVLNQDLGTISTCTIKHLGSTTYNISSVSGREYLLQGSRQNFWDPSTYCTGNWKIN